MESTEAARPSDGTPPAEDQTPAATGTANLIRTRLDALPETLGVLAWPFYVSALLLIVIPAVDFVGTVTPAAWTEIRWRFGMLGILSGFLLTPLFGVVLGMAMAAMLENKGIMRSLIIVNLAIATVFLAASGMFLLDAVQLRREVGPQGRWVFDLLIIRNGGKLLIGVAIYAWLARAALKAVRRVRVDGAWQPGDPVPLVNSEVVNVEVMGDEATPRMTREMLLNTDAAAGAPTIRASRPVMLVGTDAVPDAPPPARTSGIGQEMLVRSEAVPANPDAPAPRNSGVAPGMLIVGGESGREDDGKGN